MPILDDSNKGDIALTRYAMSSSEDAFHRIWDNDEDAVYDSI